MIEPVGTEASYAGIRATVLGASGFIGCWVTRALVGRGALVSAIVRDDGGRRRLGAVAREASVIEHVGTPTSVGPLLRRTRPDIVFNLAAYGVDPTEREESQAELVNARLVEALCSALEQIPADTGWMGQRLVHVGSALEYGEIPGDLREDSIPRPTTLYGRTKLEGTRAVEAAVVRGLAAVVARLFTVYGPGEHDGRLIPSLIYASRRTGEIPLTEGRQRRDFTYVEDAAEGLLRLGGSRKATHATVNLATGVLTEVREVVRICADLLGIDPERLAFGALPTRREEMAHDPVDIRRLKNWLKWHPSTSVEEGLRRTITASQVTP